jgi:hypothetical protein
MSVSTMSLPSLKNTVIWETCSTMPRNTANISPLDLSRYWLNSSVDISSAASFCAAVCSVAEVGASGRDELLDSVPLIARSTRGRKQLGAEF